MKTSGAVVASATAAWLLLESGYFPSPAQLVALLVLIVSAACLAWAMAAPLLKR